MSEEAVERRARRPRWRLVLACGLGTTALVLFVVYLLGQAGFNPMGFYLEPFIPLGPVLVGLAAASGYGLASWFSGVKITKVLLLVIVILQALAYFEAQYIEFKSLDPVYEDGTPVGFFEYFDYKTRSFAWKKESGEVGEPLGMWGYGIRALEVGGFVLGSLVVPLILWKKPYCEDCAMYLRRRSLGLIPAGVEPKKIKKKDTEAKEAYEKANQQAWAAGQALLEQLLEAAREGDGAQFQALLAEHRPRRKEYDKLTRRIDLTVDRCPGCNKGILWAIGHEGKGDKLATTNLAQFEVAPDFVRAATQEGPTPEASGEA